jgi:hypothetical protein
MAVRKSGKAATWREFERLISRVERTLAGQTVKVTSPDRIKSLLTGRSREVDASLRTKIGSADIIVTIECRKRSAKQDVTWIEQLSSKRAAIGAARTIAVSSTPFSTDAIRAAAFYGIDLRVATDVTDEDVQSWMLPVSVTHVYKSCDLVEAPEVHFIPDQDDDFSTKPATGGSLGVDSPAFESAEGERLSLNDLWLRVDSQMRVFETVPNDDMVHLRTLAVHPADDLYLLTDFGRRRVHEIRMKVALRWKREEIMLNDANVVLYKPANSDEPVLPQVRAEFESKEATHMNLRLGMQFVPGSDQTQFTLDVLPGKKQ